MKYTLPAGSVYEEPVRQGPLRHREVAVRRGDQVVLASIGKARGAGRVGRAGCPVSADRGVHVVTAYPFSSGLLSISTERRIPDVMEPVRAAEPAARAFVSVLAANDDAHVRLASFFAGHVAVPAAPPVA
ncbi:hypothetical protein ACIA8K_29195 [Catenuloplanes sp. NPDC051500]|uniref:hypothetical protein n=1 Tax=Catenuloplanes sp. NPDC051500 TaxID=3363959 RepID=UPI0037BD8C07